MEREAKWAVIAQLCRAYSEEVQDQDIDTLLEWAVEQVVEPQTYLSRAGEPCRRAYILLDGCLACLWPTAGGLRRGVDLLGARDFYGMSIYELPQPPRNPCDVLALVPTPVLSYEADWLIDWVFETGKRHRAQLVLSFAVHQGRQAIGHQMALTHRTIRWRTAHSLLQFQDALQREVLPITQSLLSEFAGSNREATAGALGQFRRAGWVRTGREWIEILDRPALEKLLGA